MNTPKDEPVIIDALSRQKATDPTESFIVQAPAGSGKTEILTQRFLRLLAIVNAPEHIVAITFTRKAAHEMRERIMKALDFAALGKPPKMTHHHQTYQYAQQALAQDKKHHWQLQLLPNRLRILTIDALCQRLTQAIPLQEKTIPFAPISDKPLSLYRQAAEQCFDYALEQKSYQPALQTLLHHLDNQQDQLLHLFTTLLASREQWLEPLHLARSLDKAQLEEAIAWIEQHELNRFKQSIPNTTLTELMKLARQLAQLETNEGKPYQALIDWQEPTLMNGDTTRALALILLTSQKTLRKSFDQHVGLIKSKCSKAQYSELKSASQSLFNQLQAVPEFLEALLRVSRLPKATYEENQWRVLQALFELLPLLTAHLQLVFTNHHQVDFSFISQQAQLALGSEQSPTDLALYLDYQIHHLLVDEFQDTSIQQFALLSQLVQGWQPGDGRTLFVVGDPMQSIYRFRGAEVGLFLRAKQQGIGPISLKPLYLTCNFRSTATIVDWVNHHFSSIFPTEDDMESGAIVFHQASPVQEQTNDSVVQAWQCENEEQEAFYAAYLIEQQLASQPDDSIAVLVRSRQHLTSLIRALKSQGILFQGIEMDLLSTLPHVRDVWVLTQALLMPANRLAWLALLRSPWCGLSLADIHSIALFSPQKSIYFALSKLEELTDLTKEGRKRAAFIYHVLDEALRTRCKKPLVDWLMETLHALHLPHVLSDDEQDDLEQYWLLLERFTPPTQLPDWQQLNDELNRLYSQKTTPAKVQLMTIHKSKGLEFDSIILPALSSKPNSAEKPLLRFLKLPSSSNDCLLISPIKAASSEHCLLYDYLEQLEEQKSHYEQQRLLYVATTRAKKRLYLLDRKEKGHSGSFRHLLVEQPFNPPDETCLLNLKQAFSPSIYPPLKQLPLSFYQKASTRINKGANSLFIDASLTDDNRQLGILTHQLLQWLCTHHPQQLEELPWPFIENELRQQGFDFATCQQKKAHIKQWLQQFLQDPIGQWIAKRHQQEQNEYELLVSTNEGVRTRIIDRQFCENGIRWVIDFKTGRGDEQTQHQHQLNEYAHLLRLKFPEPVHCGLYYLSTNEWLHWPYSPTG